MDPNDLLAQHAPEQLSLQEQAERNLLPGRINASEILDLWMGDNEGWNLDKREQLFKHVIFKAVIDRTLIIRRLNNWTLDKRVPTPPCCGV